MPITIDQLLATLGLDAADALVVSDRFVVIMRDPQPGELGVPVASTVYMRIVDLSGVPADPSTIAADVYLDQGAGEVLAYEDGVGFHAPWNGPASAVATSGGGDPYCFVDLTLDQAPDVFASEQLVAVRIALGTSVGGWGHFPWGHAPWGHFPAAPGSLDIAYSFTAADVEPLRLLRAEAIAPRTVRLTFDDTPATSGAGSVLALAQWPQATALQRQNVDPYPAVDLYVTGVAVAPTGGGTQIDLTTQWEMTPGQAYLVTVAAAVTDESGNAMDAAASTATFLGFAPALPVGRIWDYWRLMPLKNRLEDYTHDLERFARSLHEVVGWLTYDVDHFTDQFDPDLATDVQIDAMLADVGNPFEWVDLDLTAAQRRRLLRVLVDIYQSKGTARGIEDTVYFLLGLTVRVVEYLAGGWVLGEDELGEGAIAELYSDLREVFDFSGAPAPLVLEVDGVAQTFTFELADFAVPAAATAEEVARALNGYRWDGSAWAPRPGGGLAGAGAYVDKIGTAARIVGTNAAPFALVGGEVLDLTVDGVAHAVYFHAADFATPGAATVAEVAARIVTDTAGRTVARASGLNVEIATATTGISSTIEATGGTAGPVLGFAPGAAGAGTDAARVAIYSETVGVDATLLAAGGAAIAVLGLATDPVSGTGGAILAPSDQYALYSFDIETQTALDSATEQIVRRIAEYMKPAHTHLVRIRTALPLPWPEGWTIGIDELDATTELML